VPLSRNLGTLTSWNPLGYSRPVTGLLLPLHALYWQLKKRELGSMKYFSLEKGSTDHKV
jgi:hypothetical protein